MIEEYRVPMSMFCLSPRDFGERILAMKLRLRGGWKRKHRRRRA